MRYRTFPYKSGDRGTVFGNPIESDSRKQSARDRSDICREMSSSQRAWTGAITYGPFGIKQQTQASPVE